jgi:sulfite oxidase
MESLMPSNGIGDIQPLPTAVCACFPGDQQKNGSIIMQTKFMQSRRTCLQNLMAGAAALSGVFPLRPSVGAEEKTAGKLIVRQEQPFNAEPPLEDLLKHWLTDYGTFFQRSHGNVPTIDADRYRLTVEGLVERPLTLSLRELKEKFPEAFAAVTITCAGNRRSEFPPGKIAGVQWHAGAISTAEWKGAKLSDVLKHAGLKPEAKHVWFDGLDDVVEGGKTISFGGSIPIEKAMSGTRFTPGALLVHSMNNQPLPKEHGAPLRTVVPGYIGARSVKWLGKIVVSDKPSPNHFIQDVYKLVYDGTEAEKIATPPIYEQALNSVIGVWKRKQDQLVVTGFALPSGHPECLIKQVEVSVDDGKSWTPARITSPQREFCWVFWEALLPAAAAGKTALVRATDTKGETQPREMKFNLKGYQLNSWHRVELKS